MEIQETKCGILLVLDSKESNPSVWELPSEAHIAARVLYSKFRELDQLAEDEIIIQINSNQINDENFQGILNRLFKAASRTLPKDLSNDS